MRKFVYRMAYVFAGKSITRKNNFVHEPAEVTRFPFIVLCNHNTDNDGFYLAIAFRKYHMYFVMSEHTLRRKTVGPLIKLLLDPIARQKGMRDFLTIKQILTRLKNGNNVCIFAEGNRSPNGLLCPIAESTGKLVKMSKATLVTYRLTGAYFSQPRWATSFRRGEIKGELIGEYSPEILSEMSVEEVNALILRDLFVDDYAEQTKSPVRFAGERLAEKMETVFYYCPDCKKLSTLVSNDDTVSCECGLKLKYDEYGFLSSLTDRPVKYDNLRDWYIWQTEELKAQKELFASYHPDKPITSDNAQHLKLIKRKTASKEVINGKMTLYSNRLCFTDGENVKNFPLADIESMEICDIDTIVFSTVDRVSYEIVSEDCKNAYKYTELISLLK